jgi:pimeloyl-ACP methyl ester carboxylesterase
VSFFRIVLGILQRAWPAGAAWLAERLFFTPSRRAGSASGRTALAAARRFTLQVDGRRVVGWRWGEPDARVVYLVHGWASRGSRLAAFTAPLVAAGYAVTTFDSPGHGASAWGMSSLPEFARALRAVVAREEKGGVAHAVIAHSFGCAGTALALSWGLEVERLAFLAPAADPPSWVQPFARSLGIRPEIMEQMRMRSERRIRHRWADMNVCDIARRLPAAAPLLIVHDRGDETVSWNDGVAIAAAWPGARFLTTEGLGHRGVTHSEDVVREVVAFVTGDTAPRGSPSSRLEHELFYRGERV